MAERVESQGEGDRVEGASSADLQVLRGSANADAECAHPGCSSRGGEPCHLPGGRVCKRRLCTVGDAIEHALRESWPVASRVGGVEVSGARASRILACPGNALACILAEAVGRLAKLAKGPVRVAVKDEEALELCCSAPGVDAAACVRIAKELAPDVNGFLLEVRRAALVLRAA